MDVIRHIEFFDILLQNNSDSSELMEETMFTEMYNYFRVEMNSGSILGYFLQALPIALLVGTVYAVLRTSKLKKHEKPMNWPIEVMRWLFACYLTGLCSLVILPANFWLSIYDGVFFGSWDQVGPIFHIGEINLIPTIVKCFTGEFILGSWVKQMLLGNIAMLIPLGFFLHLITKKYRGRTAYIAAIIIPIIMESLQLIFGRSFDIDDLICNFIGIILGFLLAWGAEKKCGASWSGSNFPSSDK